MRTSTSCTHVPPAGCSPPLDWREASPPRVGTAALDRAESARHTAHARSDPPSLPRCSRKEYPGSGSRVSQVASWGLCTDARLLDGQASSTKEDEEIISDPIKQVPEEGCQVQHNGKQGSLKMETQ